MLDITVCIKQVPSISDLKIDQTDYTLVRSDSNQILNPSDESALETAFMINDAMPGQITALSMGRPSAESILKEALNLGADRALLISDKNYAGSDTCATATILSRAIEHLGENDLIVCGSRSADGETGQVGPELSVALGIPCITNVMEVIKADKRLLKIKKLTDNGCDILQVRLPVIICVEEGAVRLRPPGIKSMRNARDKNVEMLDNSVLQIDEKLTGLKGSPTKVIKVYTPKFEKKSKLIERDGTQARKNLIGLMEEKINQL